MFYKICLMCPGLLVCYSNTAFDLTHGALQIPILPLSANMLLVMLQRSLDGLQQIVPQHLDHAQPQTSKY